MGEDFRFGYERKGTPQLLETMGRKLGFTVDVVPKEMEGRRKISSTFIREELKKGNMEKVNDLLGIPFFVDGVIEHGRGMGHKVLLPTTNIVPAKEKLMPPNGVYDTVSHFKDRTLCGITNVGYKPTIGEKFLGVETYLFDCEEDLYRALQSGILSLFQTGEALFVHRSTKAAAPEGCRKGKGLFPQSRKIKTFGKNFSKKQFTGQKPCAILFEVKKASIQKPETPTTS